MSAQEHSSPSPAGPSNPEHSLLLLPLPHPTRTWIFLGRGGAGSAREDFSSPLPSENSVFNLSLPGWEAAPELPSFIHLFIHSQPHISCAGCVLQPLPPFVPQPSTPPETGIRRRILVLLQPLLCSLIQPVSSIPCSEDGFILLLGTLAAVSAHQFGMCRWWGLCSVLLGSSHQEVTLSRG